MQIGETKRIVVHLKDPVRMFEKALDRAQHEALYEFGIDEDAHSDKVEGWERSDCSIKIRFMEMEFSCGMGGGEVTMIFNAWCEKYEEEEYEEDE